MHGRACIALAVLLSALGCGQPQRSAAVASPTQSPSSLASPTAGDATPSPASTPSVITGVGATAFVLVDRYNAGDSSHYRLAIVGTDGRLIKVLTPDEPSINQTGPSLGSPALVSISSTRVYYLDGDSSIGYFSRNGSAGLAATLPGGPQKLVSFAVSPDDTRIAAANPYNATDGYQVVDTTNGQVLDTIPSQCAFGLLVEGGTPCARPGGGVGLRDWGGNTTWYASSAEANFSTREALSIDGTVAANSSPGSIGLFHNGTKIDAIASVGGSAVAMGWIDATHLVVRHFNGSSAGSIIDTKSGAAVDVALSCGPSAAPVRCTDAVMISTF